MLSSKGSYLVVFVRARVGLLVIFPTNIQGGGCPENVSLSMYFLV